MSSLAWIAVDWGTSSLRIWGLDADNQIVFHHASNEGMGTLDEPSAFEATLLKHIHSYLQDDLVVPVVCCGMVGAKQGWQDAGYQALPCNPLAALQAVSVAVTDARMQVWIIPGLCQSAPADVMRGEETQIAGVLAQANVPLSGMICLPGTHSKWALCEGGAVTQFATFMTGEMFALLAEQSVLRFSVSDSDWHQKTFTEAVVEAYRQPASISNLLFSVRAGDVLNHPQGPYGKSRLSGLLIGLELAGARSMQANGVVHLVGGSELASIYQQAMAVVGIEAKVHGGESIVLAGLSAAYLQLSNA